MTTQPVQAEEDLVKETCPHCGAVYEFGAGAIPVDGYDGRCGHCGRVFFVRASRGVEVLQEKATIRCMGALARDCVSSKGPFVDSDLQCENLVVGQLSAQNSQEVSAQSLSDLLGDSVEIDCEAGQAESDVGVYERSLLYRTRRRVLWLCVVGLVVFAPTLMYCFFPAAFDASFGQLIGVRLTVDSSAAALVEQAKEVLWLDTDQAYTMALDKLNEAEMLADSYAPIMAFRIMVHTLRGLEQQGDGRVLLSDAMIIRRRIEALEGRVKRRRSGRQVKEIENYGAELAAIQAQSKLVLEGAGQDLAQASRLTKSGLKRFPTSYEMMLAAGIQYASDTDTIARARTALKNSLALKGQRQGSGQRPIENDPWILFLKASILLASDNSQSEAIDYLETAIRERDDFTQARLLIAKTKKAQGHHSEAVASLQRALARSPSHVRSKRLLGKWRSEPQEGTVE